MYHHHALLITLAWATLVSGASLGHAHSHNVEKLRDSFVATDDPPEATEQRQRIREVVAEAFAKTHDGWSVDEVILQDELNQAFISECQRHLQGIPAVDFNWTLLNLRKAGQLSVRATQQNRQSFEEVLPLAEIVARSMQDRHEVSTDRIMADPQLRQEFDEAVHRFDDEVDLYLVRKAAFRLRKSRELAPELVTRVADWGREIIELTSTEIKRDFALVPTQPGVYIVRDRTGYLYIGEAIDLRRRLTQHFTGSDRAALMEYLEALSDGQEVFVEIHAFDPDSRASETMVRRAYESELIRTRNPRFNVRP